MARWLGVFAAAAVTATGTIEAAVHRAVDDHHGTDLTATLLPIGQPVAGTLSDPDDVDSFRLDLAAAARIEVRTSGGTDTRGRLVNSSGATIARDDHSGPGGHNFRFVAALEPGVHYVEVSGAAGDFWVMARLADALDQGHTVASSTLLTLHPAGTGAAAEPDIRMGVSGRIGPFEADVDVFRVDVPHDGTYVTIRSSGHPALRASLVDSSVYEVAHSGSQGGYTRMRRRLDAGTYYLQVSGDEVGPYRLLATGEPTSDPCAQRAVARDHGGTFASSTLLAIGGPSAAGTIANDADVDVFRLDVVGDTLVEVRTTGSTETRGELYEWGGAMIASNQGGGAGGHNFRFEVELAAGIYYVAVAGAPGAHGEYAVAARRGAASDHGDVPRTSARLSLYDADDLARVAPDMLLATAGRILPKTDEDVFRLDVARDGTVVRIRTSGGTPLYADLMHAAEALIVASADSGRNAHMDSGGNVHMEARLDEGVYYLVVGGYDTGAYRVLAWGYEPGFAPPVKAAFDMLAVGKRFAVPFNKSVVFHPARRFTSSRGPGRYTYDRGACPHVGWLELAYDDGGRCVHSLTFTAFDTGVTRFSCDDRVQEFSGFSFEDATDREPTGDGAVPAYIPDAELARGIRRALYRAPIDPSPVTVGDMKRITRLHLSGVDDLTGLDLATDLRYLEVEGGHISDLSPLTGLTKLEHLGLAANTISDLSPLAGLTELEFLVLSDNVISDPWPLARLTELTFLRLGENRIRDLSPLAGLTKLAYLDLADNIISDLSPLAGLTALTSLTIGRNRISDLSPLAGMRLGVLSLEHNRIWDLSPLSRVTWTWPYTVDLSDNEIQDVGPLSGLVVGSLDLSYNEISDLTPFGSMSVYATAGDESVGLYLQGNRISDVSPLVPLLSQPDFRVKGDADDWPAEVDLGHNSIVELPPLTGHFLLNLAGNRITRTRSLPIGRYTNLEGNALAGLESDRVPHTGLLLLGGNELSDLSSLYVNRRRSYGYWDHLGVSLWRNPLSALARGTQLPEMQRRAVRLVGGGQLIPFLANARQHPDRQGVLRLVNLSTAGARTTNVTTTLHKTRWRGEADAWLYAPRLGDGARPAAVVVAPSSVVHIDVEDIKRGARDKRVYGRLPIGSDDALLEVYTSGRIEAYAYVRVADGFLTSMHDLASVDADGQHIVPIFNPASDPGQASLLRLINTDGSDAHVSVTGIDDAGVQGGPVRLVLPARSVTVLGAASLESGSRPGLSGRLGDGEGRWSLEVSSDRNIAVMSLLESPTGHLTNLSTSAPGHIVPLFLSASRQPRQGWVRVVNRGRDTKVVIRGIDDAGSVASAAIAVEAGAALTFNSDDWENGNASRGFPGAGRAMGDWRLEFSSDGDMLVGAYVETEDGFLSSVHDRVKQERVVRAECGAGRKWPYGVCDWPNTVFYVVSPFTPATSDGLVSSLRLLNDGHDAATVAIWGIDERGYRSGPVDLALAAGTARTVTARKLAAGGEDLVGWLTEGAGTWELLVAATGGHVTVVNLLEDASGHIANLSTAPIHRVVDPYR